MDVLRSWKIHVLCLILTVVAEFIGIQRFGIVVFLPLLYALILGLVLSIPKFKLLTVEQMTKASDYLALAVMILIVKVGLGIGPNLGVLMSASWALLFQELGHFLGTIIFGLPVALLLKMRREAVGACYSVDREPNVAIIIDKYGMSSPEGRGVMGMYICGVLIGAMWISILAGVMASSGLFHPLALAMGAGVGSASMMAASTAPIIAVYPEWADQITALAGAANLLTTVLGVYFSIFISLPVMEKLYNLCTGRTREEDLALDAELDAKYNRRTSQE